MLYSWTYSGEPRRKLPIAVLLFVKNLLLLRIHEKFAQLLAVLVPDRNFEAPLVGGFDWSVESIPKPQVVSDFIGIPIRKKARHSFEFQ